MKRETQVQSIDGNIVKLMDGTTWLVDDPHNAPHALPHWNVGSRVETEDFGLETYIFHFPSEKKLRSKRV